MDTNKSFFSFLGMRRGNRSAAAVGVSTGLNSFTSAGITGASTQPRAFSSARPTTRPTAVTGTGAGLLSVRYESTPPAAAVSRAAPSDDVVSPQAMSFTQTQPASFVSSRPQSMGLSPSALPASFVSESWGQEGAGAAFPRKRLEVKAEPQDLVGLAVLILSIGTVIVAIGVLVLIGIGRMDSGVGAKLIGGLLGTAAITGLAGVAVRRKSSKSAKLKSTSEVQAIDPD